jgi:hypothetical protein
MDSDDELYSELSIEEWNNEAERLRYAVTEYNILAQPDPSRAFTKAIQDISLAIQEVEQALEMHSDKSLPLTDEAMKAGSGLLKSCHDGLAELVLILAKEELKRGAER